MNNNTRWIPALTALCALVFAQTLGFDFVNYDDFTLVRDNPQLNNGFSLDFLQWSLSTYLGGNWNPLVWWSFELDNVLFGPTAQGHHLSNLLLHCVNTALVFLLFLRLRLSPAQAALAAAIFAVHPMHVEAVAWITARKDLLSTLFGLLAVYCYLERDAQRAGISFKSGIAVCMLLSLMAKPMFVTLPGILLLMDYWPLQRKIENTPMRRFGVLLIEKWPLLLIALAAALIGYLSHLQVDSISNIGTELIIGNVLNSYWLYLEKFVAPLSLSPTTPITGVDCAVPLR